MTKDEVIKLRDTLKMGRNLPLKIYLDDQFANIDESNGLTFVKWDDINGIIYLFRLIDLMPTEPRIPNNREGSISLYAAPYEQIQGMEIITLPINYLSEEIDSIEASGATFKQDFREAIIRTFTEALHPDRWRLSRQDINTITGNYTIPSDNDYYARRFNEKFLETRRYADRNQAIKDGTLKVDEPIQRQFPLEHEWPVDNTVNHPILPVDNTPTTPTENDKFSVNGVFYETFEDAISNAPNGSTIKLINDIDITQSGIEIAEDKEVTIDLGGNEIKASNSNEKGISVEGKLTISDSDGNGKIYTEDDYSSTNNRYVINVNGNGELIVESGYIDTVRPDAANKGQFAIGVNGNAQVTINGGTIKAGWYAVSGNGTNKNTGSKVIINGGELISTADYAIYLPQPGTVIVNDGIIYGEAGGISANNGNVIVNGGTITSKGQGSTGNWGDGTGGQSNAAINMNGKYGATSLKITGGDIIAEGDAITVAKGSKNTVTVSISGGLFSSPVLAEYCEDGYEPTTDEESGKYTVKAL